MRIALVSTVSSAVRSDAHGSVEAWTWLLTRELNRLGHAVTVFGCAGSQVEGEVVATLPGPYATNGAPDDWQLCEWMNLCRAVENSRKFDVMHSQAYLWVSLEPDPAYPGGTLMPNVGMSGAGAPGEVLVVRTTPGLVKTITGGKWSAPGTPAPISLTLPAGARWAGLSLYVQGYLIDSRATYGVRTSLTDALRLLIAP